MTGSLKRRILIVDDNAADRKLSRSLLNECEGIGFKFDEVETGAQGVESILNKQYDCALLSYELPDMTGLEFLRLICGGDSQSAHLPCIPCIILSNNRDDQTAVQVIHMGAEDYIGKARMDSNRLCISVLRAMEVGALRKREKETREALLRSEKLFRTLAEVIPFNIWVTDKDRVPEYVNLQWQRFSGKGTAGTALGSVRDMMRPDQYTEFLRVWEEHAKAKTGHDLSLEFKSAAGDWHWMRLFFEPLLDRDGNIERWFAASVDVTAEVTRREEVERNERRLESLNAELVRAYDEALAAAKSKNVFLASMSHELRTPLNVIIGYVELVMEEISDAHLEIRHDLTRVIRTAEHLLELINDILDLARIEAGKIEVKPLSVELDGLVAETVDAVQPLISKNNNEIRVFDSHGICALGDPTRIRQILYNLLSNAAKFTRNGQITLTVGTGTWIARIDQPQMAVITVADSGVGISKDKQESVFEPFVQEHRNTPEKYGGSGLGLTISRRLCRLMDGELALYSAEGQGSTFTVYLPLCESTWPREETQPSSLED